MDSDDYKKLLQCDFWKKKVKHIHYINNYKCVNCGATSSLEVHHKYYYPGKLPWEYTDNALITLCHNCHELEHLNNPPKQRKKRSTSCNKKKKHALDLVEEQCRILLIESLLGRKVEKWEF